MPGYRFLSTLIVGVSICSLVAIGEARAECASFPKVDLWGKISHDKIQKYVARKHDGDWQPYVSKWQKQYDKLMRVKARNSKVVFRKQGITLKGEALADYIDKVDQRIKVTLCLAEADGFDNFDTAAGRADKKKAAKKLFE
jgi:hypothetical protein